MTTKTLADRLRAGRIRRIFIYGAAVLLLATAQCSFFSRLHILPATPDLMLPLVLAILLLDSANAAMVTALAAGYVIDALGSPGLSLSSLFYFLTVLILCIAASKMLPRFFSYCLLLLAGLCFRSLYTVICLTLVMGAFPGFSALPPVLLPELWVTALLALPLYPLMRLCMIPIRSRNRFRF